MLPRRLRLSRRAFPAGRAGFRAGSEHFTIVFGPSSLGGCAAVVSKKIARRAVDRHLLKRRIFSVIRAYCTPDRFIVVYAREGSLRLPFRALTEELLGLIQSTLRSY